MEQLAYFKEQAADWESKAEKFRSDRQLWRYPCAQAYGNVKGEEYGWRIRVEEPVRAGSSTPSF